MANDTTQKKNPPTFNATVVERRDENPTLSIFRVKPDAGVVDFKAGQFVVLGLPAADGADFVRRAYSISSPPSDKEALEFYIQLVENGSFTPKLWKLRAGDRIWVGPKAAGAFTFDSVRPGANVLMIGTGTGLAPYVSMISEHLRTFTEQGRKLVVAHGARYARDLGYRRRLTALDIEHESLLYAPSISRPTLGDQWVGHVGRVESLLEDGTLERAIGEPISPERFHVFLCGHPGMCDGVTALMLARGFKEHKPRDPGNLHAERYW